MFVLVAWLASMSWLFVAKILPTLQGGDPPDYSTTVAESAESAQPTVWRITWKDRRIGTAAGDARRQARGTARRYVVQFEHMPLQMMLSEAFGAFGSVFFGRTAKQSSEGRGGSAWTGEHPLEVDMLLATEMRFDKEQRFTSFQTIVDLGEMKGFLRLRGRTDERGKLLLTTRIGSVGGKEKSLRHELDLPTNAIINDSFAPRPELKNLRVGQKWTIPVYRPFPPNSPVQIVAAHAERHELILWDGHDVETILVVYRDEAGSGLNATREPIAREWVRSDGVVLQHEVRWSGTNIRFERIPEAFSETVTEFLSDEVHPRYWSDD
jgi:hypothetical protein